MVVLGEFGGNPGDLRDELLRGKAALLYGDRVLIKSHKVPFLLGLMAAKARLLPQATNRADFDEEMGRQIAEALEAEGLGADTPLGRLLFPALRRGDGEMFFKFHEAAADLVQRKGELDSKKFFRASASIAARNYFRSNPPEEEAAAMRAVDELVQLNETPFVDVETADSQKLTAADVEDVQRIFEDSLAKAIETFTFGPLEHPLLARANRAELAASMLADVPALPTASVDELLDIRDRVKGQLGRFRAAVADLEEELNAEVGDADFAAEVEDLKLRRVTPELEELRESLRDEGLGQTASRSAPYLASGVLGLGASVAMGAPELASAMAASAGATTAVAKEIVARAKFDRERKKHRLFLLFDVERRLSRRELD